MKLLTYSPSWNLPPGCTPRDIDRAMGELCECAVCGREAYADTIDSDGLCRTCQRAQAMEDEDR